VNFDLKQPTIRLKALRSSLLASYADEDLHQLRVTLRRMRSVLRDIQTGEARELRRELGALARATNSARDWDTLISSARDQLKPEQFRELQALLHARRETARAQVYRRLHSKEWLATIKCWETYVGKTSVEADCPAIAPRELKKSLQRTTAAGRKAMSRDDDRSWHKLRIAIKELRYTLDALAHKPQETSTARLLDQCKSLQAQLGDWHDTVVHRQLLDELANQGVFGTATPTSKAASALHRVFAIKGQRSLEQVKLRLLQGDLDLAADALPTHG
jgi:CHAD domain-containing protein